MFLFMEIIFWLMCVITILGISIITSSKLTPAIDKQIGYWLWCISNVYFVFYFWNHSFIAVSIMFAFYSLIAIKSLLISKYRR